MRIRRVLHAHHDIAIGLLNQAGRVSHGSDLALGVSIDHRVMQTRERTLPVNIRRSGGCQELAQLRALRGVVARAFPVGAELHPMHHAIVHR